MSTTDWVHCRKEGCAGRITISRAQALNAITFDMYKTIASAVDDWTNDDAVGLILVDAACDRAFSVGGDVAEIYHAGIGGDIEFSRKLWEFEYPFQERLSRLAKPYVVLLDGIVMGLGAGVSIHASHRIVTEAAVFAMPECAIGHVPDVGISALFSRMPGHLGPYLGLTGARIGPGTMIATGLADYFVPSSRIVELSQELTRTGQPDCITRYAEPAPACEIAGYREQIDEHFGRGAIPAILASLEQAGEEWTAKQAAKLRQASPLSLVCHLEILDKVTCEPTVANAVSMEYRFAHRALSEGDFLEGVRAQIIDKDRSPQWQIPAIEDVPMEAVAKMLAPLNDRELKLDVSAAREVY